MNWHGRHRKTPRVKSRNFKRGTMPMGTKDAAIDFASQKTRTSFGIANCCCKITFTAKTIDDM